MVNFGPLADEIVSLVWGTPANFNGFRVLAALLQALGEAEPGALPWTPLRASPQTSPRQHIVTSLLLCALEAHLLIYLLTYRLALPRSPLVPHQQ